MTDSWIELNSMVKTKDEYGAYKIDKDKEAAKAYFIEHVNKKTVFFHDLKEKLDFLTENEYYDQRVLDQYNFEDIKKIFKHCYSYKFRFQSYMAAVKFYESFALKTNDNENFLERYEDRVAVSALTRANGNYKKALSYASTMMEQKFQPATPVFLNAGRKRTGKEVSCFILETGDSTEGIMYMEHSTAQLSRMGGGVGINLTDIRATGDPILGREDAAKGPLGIAKQAEGLLHYFDQLGQRYGAGVGYLNAHHYDVEEFIDSKKINADEADRLKSISLGLLISDMVFQKALNDEMYYVFSPYSIEKKYGIKLSEINMNEWYETLANDPDIRKKQKDPKKLLTKIAQLQQESGYPYIIYIDNANEQHLLKKAGRIKCSNLCVEIFQIQTNSDVKHYGSSKSKFGADISCVLGSINTESAMDGKSIEEVVRDAVEMLNDVVDKNVVEEVDTVKNGNNWYKSIGIGVLNLHGFLAKKHSKYSDTKHTIDFVRTFFSTIRYYAIKHSMIQAKETGEIFKDFDKSEYYSGEVFAPYLEESHAPKTERVAKWFEGMDVPTQSDWYELRSQVRQHGMRNAYLMAVAPNASSAYIQNATPSILPIQFLIEPRIDGDLTTYYPMPHLKTSFFTYNNDTAYDMSMFSMIDIIAETQKHVDQGISMTLFAKASATTADLVQYYMYGWKKNLKSVYYTRTSKDNDLETASIGDPTCEACVS